MSHTLIQFLSSSDQTMSQWSSETTDCDVCVPSEIHLDKSFLSTEITGTDVFCTREETPCRNIYSDGFSWESIDLEPIPGSYHWPDFTQDWFFECADSIWADPWESGMYKWPRLSIPPSASPGNASPLPQLASAQPRKGGSEFIGVVLWNTTSPSPRSPYVVIDVDRYPCAHCLRVWLTKDLCTTTLQCHAKSRVCHECSRAHVRCEQVSVHYFILYIY